VLVIDGLHSSLIDYCNWVSVCVPFSLSEFVIRSTGSLCTLWQYAVYSVYCPCYRPGFILYMV